MHNHSEHFSPKANQHPSPHPLPPLRIALLRHAMQVFYLAGARMKSARKSVARSTRASIYREAARHVAEVPYDTDAGEKPQHKACCTAIYDVAGLLADDIRSKFEEFFRPESAKTFWFGDPEHAKNRPARVLALCFMAAMVEAGDA